MTYSITMLNITKLTISTGFVSKDPTVDQEIPWTYLHGWYNSNTAAKVILSRSQTVAATAALPPTPICSTACPSVNLGWN